MWLQGIAVHAAVSGGCREQIGGKQGVKYTTVAKNKGALEEGEGLLLCGAVVC